MHEVQEGKIVLEIVAFIKENLFIEKSIEQTQEAMSMLTNKICNAKGVTKQELLETLDRRNVPVCSDDVTILTLITAIELSSVQYSEITPIISSTLIDEVEVNKETGKTMIKEDTSINVLVYPHVMDHDVVPEFKQEAEKIRPSRISLDRNQTEV